MSEKAKEILTDAVGVAFIPLYRFVGTAAVSLMLIIFFFSILRMLITVAVRAFFIMPMRDLGIWVFAAMYGTAYQILMSPLMAADSLGRAARDKVVAQMELEAAKSEQASSADLKPKGKEMEATAPTIGHGCPWAGPRQALLGIVSEVPRETTE